MSTSRKPNNLVTCSECGIRCEPVYVREPVHLCYLCSRERDGSKEQTRKVNIGGVEFDVLPDEKGFE